MENKISSGCKYLVVLLFLTPLFYNSSVIDVNIFHKVIVGMLAVVFSSIILINDKFFIGHKYLIFYVLTVLILLLFSCISTFLNNNTVLFFESGFDLSIYLIITLFAIVIVTEFQLNARVIFSVILIVSSIFSIIGILQLADINFLNLRAAAKPGSTLGIRNFAAEYLLSSIPFAVFLILNSKRNAITALSSLGFLLILTYTFLLRGRISYVILAVYLFFTIFFLLYYRKKTDFKFSKQKYILIIIIFIASFSSSFIPLSQIEPERKNIQEAAGSYLKYRYEPNFGRMTFYDASFRLFLEKPVFGIGTNAFPGYYGKYQWDELGDRVVYNISFTHPHNEFLKILSENGIFAFIIFSAIICYPLIRLYKKVKFDITALPFFLCYTGVLLNMLVAFPLSNVSLMILFAFSAGYGLIPDDKKDTTKKFFYGKILSILLIFISIISIYVNYIRYKSEIKYNDAINMKFANKYKEMINILDDADKNLYPLDPNKMPLQYYLGIGYFEEGQYEKSLKCFNEANQLMPYLPAIISNKATTLYAMGNIQEAEKTLLDLESKFSHYYEPQINLMALYMNSKRYDEAKILSSRIESDSTSKYAKNHNLFILMQKELTLSR